MPLRLWTSNRARDIYVFSIEGRITDPSNADRDAGATVSDTDAVRTVELCDTEEIPEGEGITVRAADRDFAVFHADGGYWAIDNMCTHEGGPLGEGTLLGTTITCPWHYAAFDITTGESLDPIAPCGVDTYEVFVEDGVVYARLDG